MKQTILRFRRYTIVLVLGQGTRNKNAAYQKKLDKALSKWRSLCAAIKAEEGQLIFQPEVFLTRLKNIFGHTTILS